ncbi:MAG: PAS domain-containing protein [Pseudomonadota bacterium]
MSKEGTSGSTYLSHAINTLVTGSVTLIIAFLTSVGDSSNQRTLQLEERNALLSAELLAVRIELVQERALTEDDQDVLSALQDLLDAIPEPAWVKQVTDLPGEPPVFTMLLLNDAYAERLGVTKMRYIGHTDYDVWPKDVADRFYSADMDTYVDRKDTVRVQEYPAKRGGVATERRIIHKFMVRLPQNNLGVGGLLIASFPIPDNYVLKSHRQNPFDQDRDGSDWLENITKGRIKSDSKFQKRENELDSNGRL